MPPDASIPTQFAIYPLAMVALGVLVKWWMSGTEKAIKGVAESVQRIADRQEEHGREIAVLNERVDQLRGRG